MIAFVATTGEAVVVISEGAQEEGAREVMVSIRTVPDGEETPGGLGAHRDTEVEARQATTIVTLNADWEEREVPG